MVNDSKVGPYQIVYLKSNLLYGKMFDTIESALDFGHKSSSRWMILQKTGQDGVDYSWKVLPYGASDAYKIMVKLDYMRYILIGVIAFAVIYFIFFRKKGGPTSVGPVTMKY